MHYFLKMYLEKKIKNFRLTKKLLKRKKTPVVSTLPNIHVRNKYFAANYRENK